MLGQDPVIIALRIPALLIAITIHEFAHARMAYYFGDSTAKSQGRMNLNPISHLDPIGTIMILLVGFGWAKPVPINPYNFSQYRKGLRWVSFAGPMVNFALGFLTLLLLNLLVRAGLQSGLFLQFIVVLMQLNILLGIFNLIPIPPLDGSKILMSFLPDSYLGFYRQLERYAPLILLALILTRTLGLIIFPLYNTIMNLFNLIIGLIPGF
ncbi:MAG: site-2 protease family protein [Bacillota bacterium]|nr:site-2 protease family protein [Bacillota bacterium]MDW7728864.1 site-2 protease family protein [Bacillota bacterium]